MELNIGPKGGLFYQYGKIKKYFPKKFEILREGFRITLNSHFKTRRECVKDLTNIKKITKGTEGVIYGACKNDDCNYILKIWINKNRKYDYEFDISKVASNKNFGVKIYDVWICDIKIIKELILGNKKINKGTYLAGFMLMSKYNITLKQWIEKYAKN